jgi:hypothetical protein
MFRTLRNLLGIKLRLACETIVDSDMDLALSRICVAMSSEELRSTRVAVISPGAVETVSVESRFLIG